MKGCFQKPLDSSIERSSVCLAAGLAVDFRLLIVPMRTISFPVLDRRQSDSTFHLRHFN